MRESGSRISVAVVFAVIVLGSMVTTASATIFSDVTSASPTLRWTEWQLEAGGGQVIRCPVTLEAAFAGRTFHKIRGVQIGEIVRAQLNEAACTGTGGRLRFLTGTLPWRLRYRTFTGTLPAVTSIGIDIEGLSVQATGLIFGSCLYRAAEGSPAQGSFLVERGLVTGYRSEFRIPLREGAFCTEAVGSGLGTARQIDGRSITITLI